MVVENDLSLGYYADVRYQGFSKSIAACCAVASLALPTKYASK